MSVEQNGLGPESHAHLYRKRTSNGMPSSHGRIKSVEPPGTSSDKVAEIIFESVEENPDGSHTETPSQVSPADVTVCNGGKRIFADSI